MFDGEFEVGDETAAWKESGHDIGNVRDVSDNAPSVVWSREVCEVSPVRECFAQVAAVSDEVLDWLGIAEPSCIAEAGVSDRVSRAELYGITAKGVARVAGATWQESFIGGIDECGGVRRVGERDSVEWREVVREEDIGFVSFIRDEDAVGVDKSWVESIDV